MIACLVALALAPDAPPINRDPFGVPRVHAPTIGETYYWAGYAVAQDRLWQMENSRRMARGRMAEAFGPRFVNADAETLHFAYTDAELQTQVDSLSPGAREAFDRYADGVNAWIKQATDSGKLPPGYKANDLTPQPWTTSDSAAIGIKLFQLFGRMASGQMRNLALLEYLKGRPESKDKALDILDDLLWQNDSASPTTVAPEDDPNAKNHPEFPNPKRAITEKQLAEMPKTNIMELLPGVQLAAREETRRLAQLRATPFTTGSYAVAVSPSRSATGRAMLVSGPQMGFSTPSIVHEMSLEAPGFAVTGMDVPGIPGVAIGYTPNVAWGLTTGAADVEDIVYVKDSGTDGYELNGAKQQLEHDAFAMPVKGGQAKTVDQVRTSVGPVVAHTASGYLFCRRSPTWMREIKSIEAIYGLYQAKGPDDIDKAAHSASVNFNLFYATSSGDIGWRFLGDIPLRRLDLDPRLPTPAGPAGEWRGLLPFEQMPHVVNPRSGLIYNWNNKPVSWWANGATPAWGRIFHSEALGAQLGKPRLSAQDLEMAIWNIARADSSWPHFKDVFEDAAHSLVAGKAVIPPPATNAPSGPAAMADAGEAAEAAAFDGQLLDGSRPALAYRRFINRLRDQMFLPITGNFMNQDTFRLAVQESVIWNALHRRTKVDYTSGRSPSAVAEAALSAAAHLAPGAAFRDQGFPVADEPPVPYGNRGTYIQIVEATGHGFRGRNVLPPGVSESGRHSHDQSVLARSWLYKPMVPLGSP